jgi:hypothetical protein
MLLLEFYLTFSFHFSLVEQMKDSDRRIEKKLKDLEERLKNGKIKTGSYTLNGL